MILQVFDAAKIELREAVAYHNEQLMGLGDQFLQEVEQIFAQIEEGPFRFGKNGNATSPNRCTASIGAEVSVLCSLSDRWG